MGRSCQLHTTKRTEGTTFHNAYTQLGNNNRKRLAYTALVRPILEMEAVLGPILRRSVKRFKSGAKKNG
jgi:hypothetical protein